MRRPLGFRKAPPASAGWSMIEHMADVNFNSPRSPTRTRSAPARTTSTMPTSQTSASSSRISLSKRDTGFPEGFCGNRNTSLPHPNANLSPDAVITEDDINITRALARHRMSFIAQKEKQHRTNRGMALNAIEETENNQQSQRGGGGILAGGRDPSYSTVGRLALSSLHGAEFRRHLRRPGSNGTNVSDDSAVSSGTVGAATTTSTIVSTAGREGSVFSEEDAASSAASSPPSSPTPTAYRDGEMTKGLIEKDSAPAAKGKDPRDEKRDPRDGRIPVGGSINGSANDGDSHRKVKKRRSLMWFHRLIHR